MDVLDDIIKKFPSITLEEIDGVRLLNRKDTKFVLSAHLLPVILEKMIGHYDILDVNGVRYSEYQTRYFDTEDHQFYLQHHNGWTDRYKVRFRSYNDTGDIFLEVKHKVKGRTKKTRKKVAQMEETLSEDSKQFIKKKMGDLPELKWMLSNNFQRITLVNKASKERVTFDSKITFMKDGETFDLNHIVIVEVKQEQHSRDSRLMDVMKQFHIRPMKISKYCVGSIMLFEGIKYNRFKPKLLTLQRIKNDATS